LSFTIAGKGLFLPLPNYTSARVGTKSLLLYLNANNRII
jgi:hypothetical protein